jgi:glycerol-3-phosphate acyltransferase PlsY
MIFGEISLLWLLLLCPAAYLIGCFNTSIFITKHILHIDITKVGSGNAGSTNIMRTVGLKWGAAVLLIDLIKGAIPPLLAALLFGYMSNVGVITMLAAGFCGVLGNMFPVFHKFKGGKGVACAGGVAFFVNPLIASILFAILIPLTFLHRMMSITSLAAAILWPLISILFFGRDIIGRDIGVDWAVIVLYCLFTASVFLSHRKNIVRLLNGTEKRLPSRSRTKPPEQPQGDKGAGTI